MTRRLPVLDEIRASALPLAMLCPASARTADVPIREESGPANLGTGCHEALRPLAEGRPVPWDGLPEIAKRHGVALDDLRVLVALAAKLWPSVAASFPDALSEVALRAEIAPGVWLTGHVDLLAIQGPAARAGDWKTGRLDYDYSHQMRAYSALVLLDDESLEEATTTALWLREGDAETYTLTRATLPAWVASVVARVVEWDGVFHPGAHCAHCPRSHECEAANALVRRDIAAIADKSLVARVESELALMAPAEIAETLAKAKLVQGYAQRVVDAIRDHVKAHGDVVAPGVRLTMEDEERRSLDTAKAWPVLEAVGFRDDDFAACVDIRVSKAEKRLAEKAGKGNGAAAIRDLANRLADADAVEIKTTQKLVVKRV